MNYAKMLEYHNSNNADCTIAVLPVPMKEASRFGIMIPMKKNELLSLKKSLLSLRVIWLQWVSISSIGSCCVNC